MQPTPAISSTGPAAFGVIAERFRRAGQPEKAVSLCREGLEKFPDHLSARVTLGWSLLDMGDHQEAFDQLKSVLKRAPDNLAAIRGLAELHERGIGLVFDSLSELDTAELDPVVTPQVEAAAAEELDPVMAEELDPVMPAALHPVMAEELDPAMPADLDPVMPADLDPVMPAMAAAPAGEHHDFGDLDPIVEPEAPVYEAPASAAVSRFEIEDVIDAGDPDSMFDLSGLLESEPAPALAAAPAPAPAPALAREGVMLREPIPLFGGTPLALRDEVANEGPGELTDWLSRIRERRAGSVSQLMAG